MGPARAGTAGPWSRASQAGILARQMPNRLLRAALLVVTTLLVATALAVPAAARGPDLRAEPRRVIVYRVGRAMTPDTDILSRSGYAAWMIDEYLRVATPLPRLGHAFLDAERRSGVNARYLLAHAMLESGFGTSDIARFKRNLFGYGAFDRGPYRHAVAYRSYAAGVRAVAARLRADYLSPGGRWWRGFTTIRAVNRCYASDPRWAVKVTVLANAIDAWMVTLGERRLQFGTPRAAGPVQAGQPVRIDVPWSARAGARLPAGIRFAVRWTPLALVEATLDGPASAPRAGWAMVRRSDRVRAVRLALHTPAEPGLWRLEVEARDSDGQPLPRTDHPRIRSIIVRVAARSEVAVSLAAGEDGQLVATVRAMGGTALPAAGPSGRATIVEAWALPVDASEPARRLAVVPLGQALARGHARTIRVRLPAVPAIVVVRVTGDAAAVGRSLPAIALVNRGSDGRLHAAPLAVASPRDDALLGREPAAPDPLSPVAAETPGAVAVGVATRLSVPAGSPVAARSGSAARSGDTAGGGSPADAEPAARPTGPTRVLVRTLGVAPGRKGAPTDHLIPLPGVAPEGQPARLLVEGIPDGVRLVVAGIVPAGATDVDPNSLRAAWIVVARETATPATPAD